MQKFILLLLGACLMLSAQSQYSLRIRVVEADSLRPLHSATVRITQLKQSVSADSAGLATISNLPAGNYRYSISFIGFEERVGHVRITSADPDTILVLMERAGEEEEEVIVQSTRTTRNIRNVPTRVETIELEEIDEKSNMRPNNVSMLLHESTGIQVQQTSATSGNASIRVQGLDGRYTQLLKDGFAGFGNFASGLSVLEIPPLDLKQVEIIKGPASTLYGGGAISGVVNFISKRPQEEAENSFVFNQSTVGQSNLSFYSSKRNKKTGYTLLAMLGGQRAYDVDDDDFTELPKTREWSVNPTIYFYLTERSTLIIGNSFSKAIRTGGDLQVVKGRADAVHQYFEENNTIRNNSTIELQHKISEHQSLTIKQGISVFDRHIEIPAYHFDGRSINSFTDISWLRNHATHDIVAGVNLIYDDFNEKKKSAGQRDNDNLTAGAYLQDTWDISEKLKLESGLRFDLARYGNELFHKTEFLALPRISLLIKYSEKLSSRIGAGLGYKLPTLFTERTESFQYRDVAQLDSVKSERSYGGTADLNFRSRLGPDLDIAFNHLFFLTEIQRPLVLLEQGAELQFANATKSVRSMGIETNMKLIFRRHLKLFLGYTFTRALAYYQQGNQFLPLVPKHKLNTALIYEKGGVIKLGLEGYYTGRQFLYNGLHTPGFWEFGFMAEKPFPKFSLYINFENFGDARQGKIKRVANGPHASPVFDDIWMHTEGFVINGGIKLRL